MDVNLQEVVARLERLEKELEELKRKEQGSRGEEGRQGPPPYIDKIEEVLGEELEQSSASTENLLVLAAFRKEGGRIVDRLSITSRGEPEQFKAPETQATIKQALDVLQTLSSEKRLHILVDLFKGGRYPKELSSAVDLEGGALYHHLDVLSEAGFVERDELGRIVLTPRGKLLTNLLSILSRIRQWKFSSRESE